MENGIIAEGIPPEEGRFCADCESLIGVRYNKEDVATRWNCGHSNNASWAEPNLVTGIKYRIFKIPIIELRYGIPKPGVEFCGLEGKWYKKYEEPKRELTSIGGKDVKELATDQVFTQEDLEESRRKAEQRLQEVKARKLNKGDLNNL